MDPMDAATTIADPLGTVAGLDALVVGAQAMDGA
jgi:hypothetical protein